MRRRGSYGSAVVGTTDSVICGANPKRVAFTISNPGAHNLFISFGQPAVNGQSFCIGANLYPQTFDMDTIGDLITQDIHALYVTSGNTVFFAAVET